MTSGPKADRPPPLFWVKKEEMTEGRKAGWASKIKPGPFLSSKSGSATASPYIIRALIRHWPFHEFVKAFHPLQEFPECASLRIYLISPTKRVPREGSLITRLIKYLQTLTCKQHKEMTMLGFQSNCCTKKMKRRSVSNKRQGN